MKRIHIITSALTLLLIPGATLAYLNPEDVLLNRDLYLPPSAREASSRTDLQAQETTARRQREQEAAFALQRPAAPEPEEDLHTAAPAAPQGFIAVPYVLQDGVLVPQGTAAAAPNSNTLDAADLELLRTIRLLSRVNSNQTTSTSLTHGQTLHSGAPLPPTGAGAILSALTMAGAVGYTLYRSRRGPKAVQR